MDELRAAIERSIGNQYEILHLIGRGGMGAVYLGRDRFLDRHVAIKILPDAGDAAGRERFLREARTAARLTHPSIVPLYTFSQADDTLLYVMGYVEGESLEAVLKREGRLEPDRAARIMSEIADALSHAHALGVVHRDVKPDNILIEQATGRAFLTDFGIARVAAGNTMTKTGMVLGTPHYMSPEQAAGDAIDGRSDLYALGVIGYRMLSGRLPFDTTDMRELLMQHVAREPAPLDPGDSPELAAAVMRCLSKQPAARWASGSDIVEALRPRSRYDLRVPDDLEWVPSTLVSLTGLMVGTEIVTFGISRFNDDPAWLIFMAAAPLVAYPLVALHLVTNARKYGLPVRRAFKLARMAPAKWAGWWPASLRRPGDVWPRLPKIIRRVRTWFSAMTAVQTVVGFPFVMYALQQLLTFKAMPGGWLSRGLLAFALGNVVLMLGVLATTVPWRRRFGVSSTMQARLLGAPTWNNPFWERPEVARLLLDSADEPARATSTSDLLGDIERAAAELPSGIGPAVQDALLAAGEVARFVASLDQQIIAIDRDADPAEGARVAEKVAALRDGPSPMRSLLEQQLALHNELDARRRRLVDDRERAVAMLRRLRLELARSRSEFQRGETSAETLSGQIRAVCRDLERERDAVRTVEGLLEPTSSARVPTPQSS